MAFGLSILVGATGAEAQFATGGQGVLRDDIYWLSWGAENVRVSNNTKKTFLFNVGESRIDMSCTLSELSVSYLTSYRPGAWSADGLAYLYNMGSTPFPIGLVTENNQTADFRVTCSAKIGGQVFPLAGLVIADAETSSQPSAGDTEPREYVGVTVPAGKSFYGMQYWRGPTCTADYGYRTLNGGKTYQFLSKGGNDCTPTNGAGHPTVVGFVNSDTVKFSVKGGGKQAIAVGVMMPNAEFGDAPASYGTAYHITKRSVIGGALSPTVEPTTPANARSLFGAGIDPVAQVVTSRLTLGSSLTFDGKAFSGSTAADQDSDDALTLPLAPTGEAGSVYSVSGTCVVPADTRAFVTAYLDINKNGTFDADERRLVECVNGSSPLATGPFR